LSDRRSHAHIPPLPADQPRTRKPGRSLIATVLLVVATLVVPARAQPQATPKDHARAPIVTGVEAVGMTVADMDRALEFFSNVLSFQKMSDVEVAGEAYEHLEASSASACVSHACGSGTRRSN